MKQESLDLLNKWFPDENWYLLSETEAINKLIEMIMFTRYELEDLQDLARMLNLIY